MEKAIKLAIEGGYAKIMPFYSRENDRVRPNVFRERDSDFEVELSDAEVTSEPIFWQSLGKSLGWKEMHMFGCEGYMDNAYCECEVGFPMEGWLLHWHRFIDHLAEGKDPEEFFNNLLK
jgi:hypothetical protein